MAFQQFTGREYLKIDIANNYGLDKEDWDVRIAWFDENQHHLDTLVSKAEEPALFFAGITAWQDVMNSKPTGYPISLDATASGIQLLAALTGDRKAALLCNVLDNGKRMDAYTALYQAMCARIEDTAKITRDKTKEAIMTAFYSSTAVPKRVFGEGALLDTFYETMEAEAPGPWEVTKTMLAIWDDTTLINQWIMPDNFHVKIKVMGNVTDYVSFLNEPFEVNYSVNQPIQGGRSLGANMNHGLDGMLVREMTRRCDFDPVKVDKIIGWMENGRTGTSKSRDEDKIIMRLAELHKESGFFSARVLQYVDPANMGHLDTGALSHLVHSLPAKPFKVLSVHDCFRVLPNYGNDLRWQYNILLSMVAQSDLLSFMISQIVKRRIKVDKIDPEMYIDILDTNYALS